MTQAALDVVLLIHDELRPLIEELYDLLPGAGRSPSTGTMSQHSASSSAPWHEEAGTTLYGISEDARRLEASLRLQISGYPGRRRGGSDANTISALKEICELVYLVPAPSARKAGRIVSRWIRDARRVRDIGLEERPVPLPAAPGQMPPPCPYCVTFSLRVVLQDGRLWCINDECKDGRGRRPHGRMVRSDLNGDGMIEWKDGRITYRRDWA